MPKLKPSININLGLGPVTVLTLAFFVAKVLGYITWSWWLVFSPLLIVPAIYLAFGIAAMIFLGIVFIVGVLLG